MTNIDPKVHWEILMHEAEFVETIAMVADRETKELSATIASYLRMRADRIKESDE